MPPRESTRRRSPGGPQTPPAEPAATPAREGTKGAAELVWLNPHDITWPDVRITSEYREGDADALRMSIEDLGQQQPIGVYRVDGQYIGADGLNRCQAAIARGDTSILCIVREGQQKDVLLSNIATALLRGHTNPLSIVEALTQSYHDEGVEIEALAMASGKTVAWVEKKLSISQASPVIQQALGDELIALGHAEALAQVEDVAAQEEALRLTLLHRWGVRELEDHLAGPTDPDEEPGPRRRSPSAGRNPLVCTVCHTERQIDAIQSVYLCHDCMPRLASEDGDQAGGMSSSISDLLGDALGELREVEQVLAQSPSDTPLAERISALTERIAEAMGESG